ncbi:MAG: hypothetical protein QN163_03630 [Armatimonadota bacterium]|nr:hypothetical protein [Armatimonadota bacterium]
MVFLVGFNSDLDRTTGAAMGSVCGFGQGLDHFIDGGYFAPRNADGTYNVHRISDFAVTGTATVALTGSTVTLTVNLATGLEGDDGRTEAHAIVGLGPSDFRDCAPDAGQMLPTRLRNQRTILDGPSQ